MSLSPARSVRRRGRSVRRMPSRARSRVRDSDDSSRERRVYSSDSSTGTRRGPRRRGERRGPRAASSDSDSGGAYDSRSDALSRSGSASRGSSSDLSDSYDGHRRHHSSDRSTRRYPRESSRVVLGQPPPGDG